MKANTNKANNENNNSEEKAIQPQIQMIIPKGRQTPVIKRVNLKNKLKTPRTDVFTVICKSDLRTIVEKESISHPTRKWRFDLIRKSILTILFYGYHM